jgi:hypothetical protein
MEPRKSKKLDNNSVSFAELQSTYDRVNRMLLGNPKLTDKVDWTLLKEALITGDIGKVQSARENLNNILRVNK